MPEHVKVGLWMLLVGGLGAWAFYAWHQHTSTAPWYGISGGLMVMSGALAGLGLLGMFGFGKKDD